MTFFHPAACRERVEREANPSLWMNDRVTRITLKKDTKRMNPEPAIHEKLPLSMRLAFGAGDFGPAVATVIISFFQLFFLTTVAGLRPAVAGTIVLVVKIWDALNDPLIGWLSDRTRSRFGRRRPWLLYGSLPFGIVFFLLWLVPPFDTVGKIAYYLVVSILFSIAFTTVNVPYTALTPELTPDYDERTRLNAYRFAFSIGGSLLAGALHQVIVGRFCADPNACSGVAAQPGYAAAAAIWAIVSVPFFLWCFAGTRERYGSTDPTSASLIDQLRAALHNRPYLFVIGIYLCSWLGVQILAAVVPFYITFWMQRTDLIPLTLLAVQGSAFVWLFIWSAISARIGKRAVYIIGMLFWIAVQAAFFFVQPGQVALALGLAALAGVGIATAYLVPWSMMPDVIEYNELHTGERHEGIFYGFMVFLQKLGLALGLFLVSLALEWQGFNQDAPIGQQPEAALTAIRVMLGPVPTIVLVLGIVLTLFYPITRQAHEATVRELERRRT